MRSFSSYSSCLNEEQPCCCLLAVGICPLLEVQSLTSDMAGIDPSPLLPHSPLEWSSELCYFCKASNLSGLRLEAFGTLLSQTLITYSHNSQPVDSHHQAVPGVAYSPFSTSLLHPPLYSSTASGLIQIDRPGTRGRNLSEEELLVYERGVGVDEDANIFSQNCS